MTSLDDVFAADGLVSLREALQAANTDASFNEAPAGSGADIIEFDASLFVGGQQTLTLAGLQLEITDDLTIVGPGAGLLTIDANSQSRVFMVGDGTATVLDVTISDLAVAGGFEDGMLGGGGVLNDGESLTLERVVVRDNVVDNAIIGSDQTRYGGGGVFSYQGTLVIRDSEFLRNEALSGKSGGAILVTRGDVTIEGTLIANNSTEQNGGGIFAGYGGTAIIRDCEVLNNSATDPGGGIEHQRNQGGVPGDPGLLIIENTRIAGNQVTINNGNGGGMRSSLGLIQMTNCVIEENSPGGLWVSSSGFIADSIIRNNSGNDGAIRVRGGDLEIRDTVVSDNIQSAGVTHEGGNLVITRSTISNNSSPREGSGIRYLSPGSLKIINSTIARNVTRETGLPDSPPGKQGGGLFINSAGGQVDIINSTIAENQAGQGGGIFLSDGSLTMNNSIVADNTAVTSGNDAVALITGQYNLIEDGTGVFFTQPNNMTGVDPLLSDFADHGGHAQTYRLRAGSPALDAGDNARAVDQNGMTLSTDQRGAGFPRIIGMNVDLGATEGAVAVIPVVYVNDDFTQSDGTVITDADPNTPGDQAATIGTDAFATIQQAVDVVDDGGTVFITDDLASDGAGLYVENVLIDSDLTILATDGGVEAVVVDGGAAGHVFALGPGLNVTLTGLVIQNGMAANGGGILNDGSILTINDSIVRGNVATASGGGLESRGTVFLNGSQLLDNSAGVNGGGLHNTLGARAYLDSVLVDGNSAAEEGGGLWNSASGILITRGNSTIAGNTASGPAADQGGGGIFNNGGRLAIQAGTTISGNVADGAAGSGGGVFSANGIVTIDDSTISGNSATRAGGGIEFVSGVLELANSQVDGNAATGGGVDAPGDGGGIHVTGRMGQVGYIRVIGGSVSGNTAARQGGGIWHQQANILVVRGGAVIDGNTASGDAAEDGGGGIFNRGGRLSVGEGVTISNNVADGDAGSGGGIFSTGSAVSIAGGAVISGNSANRAGGGIEVIDGLVTINDSTIENNDAGITGTANPGDGGGVHISGTSFTRVDLWNSIVRNNTAARQGGGLWNQTNGVMLVRVGSHVTGNTASGDAADDGGGGIYNQGGRLIINNATIDRNNADGTAGSGGGVFTRDGVVTVENATISNNTAHRAGGGVEIIDGWFYTRNMDLVGNDAGGATPNPGDGGGLHVTGTNLSRVRIDGGTIADNTASSSGGGLWHQAGSLMVIFGGTTVEGNTAAGAGGGGIFNAGGRLAITAATLSGNSANGTSGSGGGILSLGGGLTLDNSTVSGNQANGDGGGVVSNGDFIAANATIVGNRSNADGVGGGSGGGLFNGGLATINNTIVAGNLVGAGSAASDLAGNALRPASAHNIVGDALSAGGLTHGSNGNIVGNGGVGVLALASIIDPTLASNGGPTLTHALIQNSPAIDAGNNSLARDVAGMAFFTDQRGIGFPRVVNGSVDIGAVESV